MSKTLSAFMRSNVAPITNHFYAASPRFKGEDGKPMAWKSVAFPQMNMHASVPPASSRCLSPARKISTHSSLTPMLSRPRCAPAHGVPRP